MKNIEVNKGHVIWLTGLPCSGKTTIAVELENHLQNIGIHATRLDGDVVRTTISKDLGFSKEDRDRNIERIAYVAELLARNGVHVIVSFVSPYRRMRDFARSICPYFHEVYVKCDINECVKRDVKGMYKLALEGKIKDFTGIDDPYEEPMNPDLVLETDKHTIDICLKKSINYLEKKIV
jgi:adenylylsulfate kinase